MSLFSFFRTKKPIVFELEVTIPHTPKRVPTIDKRKAECPACHQKLAKIPGAKTKCPHCGDYMYVRTQLDHTRVVATKAQADEIEKQWMIANGTYDSYLAEKAAFADEKVRLTAKRGDHQASDDDVKWSMLNRELMSHAQRGDWRLYRNTRFSMAEILRRQGRLEHALQTYLEVCYFDLNGPRNMGGITDRHLIKEFPPFDQSLAFLAGGVTGRVAYIIKQLEIKLPDIKPKFLEHNKKMRNSLKLPLSAEKAWEAIEKDLASSDPDLPSASGRRSLR